MAEQIKFGDRLFLSGERVIAEVDIQINRDLKVNRDVVIQGNLDVNGTVTTIDTTDLFIADPEPVIEQIFEVVEQNPQFVGGMLKLYEYLGKHIQYPEMAKENGIQGKVFVQFVICKNGKIESAKIVKGVHSSINNEALKVVKSMPNWVPGKQRGVPVKTRFTLPIKFKIS